MAYLETARLILRTVSLDDAAEVARSWRLDGEPLGRHEAEEQVIRMLANHRQNAPGRFVHLCLAVIHKDAQGWIGWCGLDQRDRAKANPVLFYLLKASAWGQGLATEAAGAVLGFAFGELGLGRVDAAVATDNVASRRVLEKIGMRPVGVDEEGGHVYTLSRGEFLEGRQSAMAEKRRNSFKLREFRGVEPEYAARLEALGIKSAEQMLAAGRTKEERAALAAETSIPEAAILELVELSDLARLPGVKGIRARLYYDAGVHSVDELGRWEPEVLRQMVTGYVERAGFDGIPPLPKEASSTVANARRLPRGFEE